MSTFGRVFGARRTRSGAIFNNIVTVPVEVDLEELFREAERRQADEPPPESDSESGSPLSTPPSSRPASPLTDLTDSAEEDSVLEDVPRVDCAFDITRERAFKDASHADHAFPVASASAVEDAFKSESSPEFDDGRPLQTPPTPADPPLKNSKARKSKANRKRKRQERGNDSESSKRHRAEKILGAKEIHADYDLARAPTTKTGFTCVRNAREVDVPGFDELEGYLYVDWDGRESGAIAVNREEVVMGMLVGQGKGETGHLELADKLESARGRMTFAADEREHRRGNFCVKAIGSSHGGGQMEPGLLKHSPKTMRELLKITKCKPMQRIAHLSSSALKNWQGPIHDEYADVQSRLFNWKPILGRRRNFKKSVWCCLTLNFGPRTECAPHRDFANLSYGFCAITALGRFNADKGGHLIIRELRLVIRFPAGSTIIIPSALLTHYNTQIGPDETRYSVTQYTAGAIFRFVEHGFMLNEDYYASLDAAGRKKSDKEDAARWKKGLAKLSRLPLLRERASKVKVEVAERP